MAIYTGSLRRDAAKKAAADRIAAQVQKAEAGEAKRKKRGFWGGKVGGFLAGEALTGLGGMALMALTGGALNPLTIAALKGAGMTLGKAAAHQASTGKWGKWAKTPGQVDKIEADNRFGFGKEKALSLSRSLAEQRKSDVDIGTLGGDITGSIVADIGMDQIGSFAKEKLGGLNMPGKETTFADFISQKTAQVDEFGDPISIETSKGLGDIPIDETVDNPVVSGGIQEESQFVYEDGGQVLDQQKLIQLLALAQMQQGDEKAYDNTPLEEVQPTITEMFASKGKTLGGNNIHSVAQMLGR